MNRYNQAIMLLLIGLLTVSLLIVGSEVYSVSCGGGANSAKNADSLGATSGNTSTEVGAGGIDYDITAQDFLDMLSRDSEPEGDNIRDAQTSPNNISISEATKTLQDRGLELDLATDFTLDGTYTGMTQLDKESNEKYPSYFTTYVSEKKVLWFIYINEGNVFAVPISNDERALTKEIILTEKDHLIQYDGFSNKFSDFKLDDITDKLAIQVQSIDKATLDSYTFEQLEAM